MNRLIVIGNGFDLAHGLPTSYKDFIDDYWKSVVNSKHQDELVCFQNFEQNTDFEQVRNLEELAKFIMQYDDKIKFSEAEIYREYGNNVMTGKYPREHILIYKNLFFRSINQKSIQNWVDIENEYYRLLKNIVSLKPTNSLVDLDEFEISKRERIKKLNNEFDQLKKLLEKYLFNKVIKEYNFSEYRDFQGFSLKFPHLFKPVPFKDNSEDFENFLKEFPKQNKMKSENSLYTKEMILSKIVD